MPGFLITIIISPRMAYDMRTSPSFSHIPVPIWIIIKYSGDTVPCKRRRRRHQPSHVPFMLMKSYVLKSHKVCLRLTDSWRDISTKKYRIWPGTSMYKGRIWNSNKMIIFNDKWEHLQNYSATSVQIVLTFSRKMIEFLSWVPWMKMGITKWTTGWIL